MVSLLALFISLGIVDRIPRNVCLGTGMIAVAVPLAIEAAITSKFLNTTNKAGLSAGVAFLYLYIFIYGIFLDGPGYYYVCMRVGFLCFRIT